MREVFVLTRVQNKVSGEYMPRRKMVRTMNIKGHASEFLRALRNHQYEVTPSGILFPRQKIHFGGAFENSLQDRKTREWGPWYVDANIVTTEGMNYILAGGLASGSVLTAWYIAPFAANVTPVAGLTAATFTATQTEFTSYAETTRQAWTQAGASGGVISNTASPAVITVNTGGQTTIYGLGLISASAKSATSGKLFAAALLATARTGLQNLDVLGLRYTVTATST